MVAYSFATWSGEGEEGGNTAYINTNGVAYSGDFTYNAGVITTYNGEVTGVTSNGTVVGNGVFDSTNESYVSFTYENGNYSYVDLGGQYTNVTGASDAGVLYGNYTDSGGGEYGFTYNDGVATKISLEPGVTAIVGADGSGDFYGDLNGSSPYSGYYYSNGSYYFLEQPPEYSNTSAISLTGVNDAGQAVGNYDTTGDNAPSSHGVLVTDGVPTTIDVPGAVDTYIFGINDSGEIVGDYQDSNADGTTTTHGFVDIDGVISTVDVPGAIFTEITGINDAGEIVGVTDLSGSDSYFEANPACFSRGTLIATPSGEVAVEALRIGDLVMTASGAARPIRWIGHRALVCSRYRDATNVWPVRVSAGTFGKSKPSRDLWLSPGHNIEVEGALIPIKALQNGKTIAQVKLEAVEYWHVELPDHDILLADGLPAESYLDCGNRTAFANGGDFIEAYPDFKPKYWSDTCLPLVEEGREVIATKARLLARLAEHGHSIHREADAHVLVDGVRVEPICLSETRLAFVLPAGGPEIALCSNVFIPAHTVAESADTRELGLCVGALQIDGTGLALEDEQTCAKGWHKAEFTDDRFSHRWTTGATALPRGARIVIVDLAGAGHYWRDSDDKATSLLRRVGP